MPGTVSLKMTKIHFKRPVKQCRWKRSRKMKRVKEEKGKRK